MTKQRALVHLPAFALCVFAVASSASVGRAQTIDLSLNLRYNDPADPSEGGVWYLVGKTTGGGAANKGIAGVSAYLQNVSTTVLHGTSVTLPAGQNSAHGAYPAVGQTTINNLTNGGNPYNGTFNGANNVVYGQDTTVSGIIGGIGQGSGAGNVANDPLKNSAYSNYAALLSGTFTTASRPSFASLSGPAITDGNVLSSTTAGFPALDAITFASNLQVRGDSLGSLNLNAVAGQGLLAGDVNRDFVVNGDDLNIVLLNFEKPGKNLWDLGDVNDSGTVNGDDLNLVLLNFGKSSVAPGVTAAIVPASETLAPVPPASGLRPADFDENDQVDANDFLSWQRGASPTPLSAENLADWQAMFGTSDEIAAAVPISPADFDEDGDVDGADLARWRDYYGAGDLRGDADGDGDTDGNDLLVWQRDVGQTPATPTIASVPEPCPVALTILGALTLNGVYRRRVGR